MSGVVLVDPVRVTFCGDRGGDGPVTLGQHNTMQWTGKLPQGHFLAMTDWVFQVPDAAGLDDVADAWGVLLSRHESLRTTYPAVSGADGWPVQRVADSGEMTVSVYEAGAATDAATVARTLVSLLRSRPFELDRELPVRVAVAVTAAGVRAVVAVYSHMAVDFAAMAVLGRQFTELVAGPVARVAGPRRHQPLDQAAFERSARGRKRTQATLRYWEEKIRRGPHAMFALPEPEPGGEGPAAACELVSPAAGKALAQITGRTGASPAVVTLAAVTAVLTFRTASPRCLLVSLSNNRVEVRLRDYVGTVAQDCVMLIDAGGAGFDDLVQRAGTESIRAQTHSMFDASELEAAVHSVERARGTSFGHDFVFNNLSTYGVNPREWGLDTPAVTADNGAARDGEGVLRWWEPQWLPSAAVQINLLETEPALGLSLVCGDTRRVPQAERALLLRGTERLLTAAAAGDVGLGQLADITGMEPLVRGSDWLRIDSCWVRLPAIQRLAEDALPGATPRVFVVPGPAAPVLTAYLTATETVHTPGQAHAACMSALPGRHTAMAPGWYAVCESAPADAADLAAWRRQPLLSEGNGRAGGPRVCDLLPAAQA